MKRTLFPLDAFPQLRECARTDQPPSTEDRFRFQWFGLFYQGPAKDAFTLRLRLPGGRLRGYQLSGLAEIIQTFAGGWLELNAQGGVDVPSIPVRAAAEVLSRVEAIGLSARGTGGDCVQAVRGGYREGLTPGKPPLIFPLVCELEQTLAQSREFGDLPTGCVIVFRAADEPRVSGDGDSATDEVSIVLQAQAVVAEPTRSSFKPDQTAAETWRVLLPGSGDLGVAITTTEVVPVCVALLRIWSREADRTNREKAALANTCTLLGTERLREMLGQEVGRKFVPSLPVHPASLLACSKSVVSIPNGRLLSRQLVRLAQLTRQHGVDGVRFALPGELIIPQADLPSMH